MNCEDIFIGDLEEIVRLDLYEDIPKTGKQAEIYDHAMSCKTCSQLFYEKLNERFYSDKNEGKLSLQTYYNYAKILREINSKFQQ